MIYDLKCGCVFIEENKIITDGFALIVNLIFLNFFLLLMRKRLFC